MIELWAKNYSECKHSILITKKNPIAWDSCLISQTFDLLRWYFKLVLDLDW